MKNQEQKTEDINSYKTTVTFSILFIIIIIISKLTYLVFESYYNYQVLETVIDYTVTKDDLHKLELLGHNISSVGLALLVTPFGYLLFKRFFNKEIKVLLATLLLFSVSFYGFQKGLVVTMDKIVEHNSDKRYESYYVGLLKYGIISGNMGYEKFIKNDINITNDITSKVLISNLFLLTFIDKEIVNKVSSQGKNIITDLYITKIIRDKYDNDREEFLLNAEKIKKGWQEYNNHRDSINNEFSKLTDPIYCEAQYGEFTNAMNEKYQKYLDARIKMENRRHEELSKVDTYYKDLKKYFRYRGRDKAERKYSNAMNESFGHYVNPDVWCHNNICPSKNKISYVIDSEINKRWNEQVKLPSNLNSHREFLLNNQVRSSVVRELNTKQGLMVDNTFNYSRAQFYAAMDKAIKIQYNKSIDKFKKEFEKNSGIKNIPMDLSWKEFVLLFKEKFYEKFTSHKYANIAVKMITDGNLNKFYNELYRPYFYEKHFKQIFYSEQDFINNKEAQQRGDDFVKMLYIPPFALTMSIAAGILNLISVIAMIVFLPFEKIHNAKIKSAKIFFKVTLTGLLVSIVYYKSSNIGYINNNKAFDLIDLENNSILEVYIKSLNSIIYMEEVNSKFASQIPLGE